MKILIVRGCAMDRALPLIAGAVFTAAISISPVYAQSTGEGLVPPADLHPPINLDSDTLRARFGSSNLGLKPSNDLAARDDVTHIDEALDHASVEAKGEAGLVLGTDLPGQ